LSVPPTAAVIAAPRTSTAAESKFSRNPSVLSDEKKSRPNLEADRVHEQDQCEVSQESKHLWVDRQSDLSKQQGREENAGNTQLHSADTDCAQKQPDRDGQRQDRQPRGDRTSLNPFAKPIRRHQEH
jgi:hypothetical protein